MGEPGPICVYYSRGMDFIPQLMVTGGFVLPVEIQTGGTVGEEKLVSIYSEIRHAGFQYQSFQLDPNGAGAVMQGQPPGELVTIRPPLVQVQSALREGTVETAARKASEINAIVTRVFGAAQVMQLGIRVVYHAPLSTNDAKEFMLNRLLSWGAEHIGDLSLGGDLWGGVKYVVGTPEGGTFTFNLEPSIADQMKSLYVEIDAQFPGAHQPSAILEKAGQVKDYVQRLGSYLDKIAS